MCRQYYLLASQWEDNMNVYCVGGAVRDKLLGYPIGDKDWVVVGGTPKELIDLGYTSVGKTFPVFLHPETKEEYALARTERKTGPGYHGFICDFLPTVTLEEDLGRRDLTINAMAETATGEIIDPFGGQKDLKHRILRHVSEAFVEDPVRVLRVARFMARYEPLGFKVAPETINMMKKIVDSGEMAALSSERIWKEMEKALQEPNPVAFLHTLRACGALRIILPEIDVLYGVPQPPEHHPEIDTGNHIERVLAQVSSLTKDVSTRFAALCHDVGKGITPQQYWPKHHGHEEKGYPVVQGLCDRLSVPKEVKAIAVLVARYHGLAYRIYELKSATILDILEHLDVFRRPERLQQFCVACLADVRGRPGYEETPDIQGEAWNACYLAAKAVEGAAFASQGLSGAEIHVRVREARLQAIAKAMEPLKSMTPKSL